MVWLANERRVDAAATLHTTSVVACMPLHTVRILGADGLSQDGGDTSCRRIALRTQYAPEHQTEPPRPRTR